MAGPLSLHGAPLLGGAAAHFTQRPHQEADMTLAARVAPLFALLAAPFCVPAHAADAADYEVASSLVCDTQEQVERFVALFAGDARYPRSPAAKPRKVKDYSGGARKPELRRIAWWSWQDSNQQTNNYAWRWMRRFATVLQSARPSI
jgi:hypothetical protein